jgi:histidine phosphotransferase ChpT
MSNYVDLRITELLSSRLCHEFASPIGAINNGIEMIEEFDESMLPDALPLIGSSAKMVAARLNFYRMAYGAAGNQSIVSFADLKYLANDYFNEGRTTLAWPDSATLPMLEDGWGKLLLNMLPLAADTLPRGGDLMIMLDEKADKFRIAVASIGEGARISEECRSAMAPDVSLDTLTPRSIHAYFSSRLASRLSTSIKTDENTEGRIKFSVDLRR